MTRLCCRLSLAFATLTAVACVPGPDTVPYKPGGRTAFLIRAAASIESFSGETKDFVESIGLDMNAGAGFSIDAGARSGNSAVLVGYTHVSADASDEYTSMPLDLGAIMVKYDHYFPVGGPGPGSRRRGIASEFVISLAGIPYATFLDDVSDGWRGGMGFGVELGFCHRVVWPSRQASFEFVRYGIGFRTVKFDEFEVTGFGSAEVDESLDSIYFALVFSQRF